jgi:hypothetical protein
MTDTLPFPPRRYLSRTHAAQYLGVCVAVFDAEVRSGRWPPAMRRGAGGTALTWDRLALDAAADRHSGLARTDQVQPSTGPTPGEMAALERVSRGTTTRPRHQGRPQAPR